MHISLIYALWISQWGGDFAVVAVMVKEGLWRDVIFFIRLAHITGKKQTRSQVRFSSDILKIVCVFQLYYLAEDIASLQTLTPAL